MTQLDPDISAALRSVAEAWLKRPLTAAEEQELAAFQQTAAATPGGGASTQGLGDPAAAARAQAEQAVLEGQARTDSAIREVLRKIQGTTAQALQAQDREAQAILKTVEAAKTLGDLRPSALNAANPGTPGSGGMLMAQIADRLANLVKAEVQQSFNQNFGRLQQQLEQAISDFTTVKQQMQQANTATDTPQTPKPPQAAPPPAATPQGGTPSG